MSRFPVFFLAVLACNPALTPTDPVTPDPTEEPTPTEDTGPPTPTDDPPTPDPLDALWLPAAVGTETTWLGTSESCADCHSTSPTGTALRDDQGEAVGPVDLWESSMMANSGRDPIWRAVVSAEIAATRGAAEIIGQRCMACHAPMAFSQTVFENTPAPTFDRLDDGSDISQLALDGVSCTLCHQITNEGFGTEASWKGNYVLAGDRTIYGPHNAPQAAPMTAAGWEATSSSHINEANLCATCHTLITDALTPQGTASGGSVVEQAPILEMLNSTYASSTCQRCHLPARTDVEAGFSTQIARNPNGTDISTLPERDIGRHIFVGGNTLVPALLRDNPTLFNPRATAEAFDATISSTRSQLRYRTAMVTIDQPAHTANTLTFDTSIATQVGHKFPTGIPIRRAWLRVEVTDATGAQVFLSGAHDERGRILIDGQLAPFEVAGGPIAPHHDTITSPDQVQIYESILADEVGDPTYLLLRGAGYAKDNRLLPSGWNAAGTSIAMIEPVGVDGDDDYTSGGDTVSWSLDTTGFSAPFEVDVSLLYQPLSERYAQQIFLADTPETRGLEALLATSDTRPEWVAHITSTVP